MRRVLIGGLLGAAPGALLLGVVGILYATDVITSDQSQIGFVGIPLLFFGLLIGLLAGAGAAGNTSSVLAWMGIGFVAGVALSIALVGVVAGGWLILVPLLMLGGGVLGAWRHEHRAPPPSAIPH
jgi:hypothetical protein